MYTQEAADEFCGCLIAIDCEDEGYLQGEVLGVDPFQRTVTLNKPFKNGCPMGMDSLVVLPTSIRELRILKMPPKNNVTSSDDSKKEVAKTSLSPTKIQKKPSVESDKPGSSPTKYSPKKSAIVNTPSCSFENSDDGVNGNVKKGSKFTSEKQLDSTPVHGKRIHVGELLKPSLQVKDKQDVKITAKNMYTHEDSHEFCGCLISIDCEDEGYLQGEVISVDSSQRTITLGRPLKDGCPMGMDSLVVLPTSIRELKILKMPPKNNLNSSDNSLKGVAETSSTKIRKEPSLGRGKGVSLLAKDFPSKNTSVGHPSCSHENKSIGVNGNRGRGLKLESEKQLGNSSVHGKKIDVNELLKPCVQAKSRGDGRRHANGRVNSYTKYGEYKLFNNQQVAAPRVLQVNKTRTAQEPSGMPLVDCCNGYSAYQRTAVELGDPIDFNELENDYDFSANLALFDKEGLAESSPEDVRDGKSLIVTKNFRNDENILSDPKRIISWTKAAGSDASPSEYVGRLITISCGESGCYQGKVFSVDSEKQSITIERPFKDGMPLSEKMLTLLGSDMRDLKVHDNPLVGKSKPVC